MVAADIDVEKIDHFAETDAVDEIPHGPGQDERQRRDQRGLLDPADAEVVQNQHNRRHRYRKEKEIAEQRRGAGQETERGAGIPDVGNIEESPITTNES